MFLSLLQPLSFAFELAMLVVRFLLGTVDFFANSCLDLGSELGFQLLFGL